MANYLPAWWQQQQTAALLLDSVTHKYFHYFAAFFCLSDVKI